MEPHHNQPPMSDSNINKMGRRRAPGAAEALAEPGGRQFNLILFYFIILYLINESRDHWELWRAPKAAEALVEPANQAIKFN
jgi:hypothetical protein